MKRLSRNLNSMQKTQLPFVMSKTINDVAFATIDRNNSSGLKQKAKDTFEGGATPFTVGGFRYRKSRFGSCLFIILFISMMIIFLCTII